MAWKRPGAGDIRQRITIEKLDESATPDAAGHVDSWVTHFRCWSRLVPVGSREFFGANQVQANVTHQVTVRACTETRAVTAAMRFTYGGSTYNLSGPPFDPDGRRAWLVFNAIQVG